MGTVPKRHPCAALFDGEPVRHHASARRPPHAVEPAHKEVEHSHQENGQRFVVGTDPLNGNNHEEHGYGGHHQAQWQESTGVTTVGNACHDELREAICNGIHREYDAQFTLVETEIGKHRYRH